MPRHSGGLVVVSHAVTTLSAASTMQAVSDAATPASTASDAATFRVCLVIHVKNEVGGVDKSTSVRWSSAAGVVAQTFQAESVLCLRCPRPALLIIIIITWIVCSALSGPISVPATRFERVA